jgi:hypothetical protein
MNTRFLASLLGGLSRRNTPEEEARIGAQVPTNMMLPVVNKPKLSDEALAVLRENDPTTIGRFSLRVPKKNEFTEYNVLTDEGEVTMAAPSNLSEAEVVNYFKQKVNATNAKQDDTKTDDTKTDDTKTDVKQPIGTILSGAISRPKFASTNVPIPTLSPLNKKMRKPTEQEELLLDKQGFNVPEGNITIPEARNDLTIPEGRGVLQDSLNNAVEVPFGEQEKPKTIQEQLDELRGKINKKYEAPGTTMGDRLQLLGGVLSDNFGIPGENRNRLQQVQSAIQGRRAADREQFLDERGLLTTEANRLQGQLDLRDERQRQDKIYERNRANTIEREDIIYARTRADTIDDNETEYLNSVDYLSLKTDAQKKLAKYDSDLRKSEAQEDYERTVYQNSLNDVKLTEEESAIAKARGKYIGEIQGTIAGQTAAVGNSWNVAQDIINLPDKELNRVLGTFQGGKGITGNIVRGIGAAGNIGENATITRNNEIISMLDQVDGTAYESAYQSLKGGGQITEYEGKQVAAARARLSRSVDAKSYKKALVEYQNTLQKIMDSKYADARMTDQAVNYRDVYSSNLR